MEKVAVIGSGFSGISSACVLARHGFDVTVFEKNSTAGGRAREFKAEGFTFDMGPSWYWMPDVFEDFFRQFGQQPSDYYHLERLDPSYRVFFSHQDILDIPADLGGLHQLFETLEPGSALRLHTFLRESKYKYEVGIQNLVRKPGLSITELMDFDLLKGMAKLHAFQSMSTYVRKYFRHPQLIQLLEFPVLFLGAAPQKIPALYSLMNYADMALGTWYPIGGMHRIVEGMTKLAASLGVKFEFNSTVQQINVRGRKATGLLINEQEQHADYIVASADYHHVEQTLLPASHRKYSEAYWERRVMAPSCLIFYVGINKRLQNLLHHNLFFDRDFGAHIREIYEHPSWPSDPLFYVCCPSKTDRTVAPAGHENLFILIPVAPGLQEKEGTREQYFNLVIRRLEKLTGQSIHEHVIFKRSYAHRDFITDYNAFKGNGYGLANTLLQTANLKPSILNKKVTNLFYTGQLTVPGPGVPPSIISGTVVARELIRQHEKMATANNRS